jgi:hypothetical protein
MLAISVFIFISYGLPLRIQAHVSSSMAKTLANISRSELLLAWNETSFILTDDFILKATSDIANKTVITQLLRFVRELNATYDQSVRRKWSEPMSFVQGEENVPSYNPTSKNPHCDTVKGGPKTVKTVVHQQAGLNPLNSIPSFTFDMGQLSTDILNKASGPAAAQQGMTGLITMTGIMMVKNMVQSAASTAISIGPPMIPPVCPFYPHFR